MGLLDHRQRIIELTSAEPSGIPEEESYLEETVSDGSRVRLFTEFARGPEWLTWLTGRPEFQRLFEPTASATECTIPLAQWFAHKCVMDEGLSEAALMVVQQAGGRLSPTTWNAIGQALHIAKGPRPAWLRPWLLGRRRPYGDVRLRGDDYWLREAWTTIFLPNVDGFAADVLPLADRHLRRAYLLQRGTTSADSAWDPLSFRRSAIEEHGQDRPSKSVDVLIDVARDCLESLLDGNAAAGAALLDTWTASDMALLRRLALHGWCRRKDVDATDKLSWLLERGWLFEVQLRHEVFRLLETTVADADPAVADRLVQHASGGPDHEGDRDDEIFNVLVWIVGVAPDLPSARAALDRVRAAHPEWA